jgi:hypothetical protein
MVIYSPIIKLDARETFDVLRVLPIELATVRLQDLVLKDTFRFKKTYYDIVSAGGLHNFLHFRGQILLSLIMRDEIIAQFTPKKYAMAINSLIPDFYMTINGETYEREYSLSLREIKRIHADNKILVALCSKYQPIGLVKGCTEKQIELHINLLKSLGIKDFALHVGDFFRHGDVTMIRKARSYASIIRRHAKRLILYGMGAQERLLEFSFADVYVSFNHFVTAKNGMMFVGTKKIKYSGSYDPKIVISNFVEMYKNLNSLSIQMKLL